MEGSLSMRNGNDRRFERLDDVVERLAEMRAGNLWPTGPRGLWADAFGLVLLVSLYRSTGDARHLGEARSLVAAVEGVLRPLEERRRDLAAWILALGRLARIEPQYRAHAVELVHRIHERFVVPSTGKRTGEVRHPGGFPRGNGLETVEPFLGYVAYRALEEPGLSAEIADLREQVERSYRDLVITRDLALGAMLWLTHFHPGEPWAQLQRGRCLRVLEHLWVDPPGYFCREPGLTREKSAVANHVISIGLQSAVAMPERVEKLRHFLRTHDFPDDQNRRGETRVLGCCADLPGELLCTRTSA
jgi:hypothetical protein